MFPCADLDCDQVCGVFFFFSLKLKQLSLLSLLLKTCFLVVEIVCEAFPRTLFSLCTKSLNYWRQNWTWRCGCMTTPSPVCINLSLQQGPVSFSYSSPCFLTTTLHLQHLCLLLFLLLPLLWNFLYPLCFLSLKDRPSFWWCAYFPLYLFPRT